MTGTGATPDIVQTRARDRQVRQNILDGLRLEKVVWSGALEEVEFLSRIFDLQAMPSYDSRFGDASGDIWQHRVNNPTDWDDDWIFSDRRFSLLDGELSIFLQFLAQTVHPVVRPDRVEAETLVQQYNEQLRQIGWHLIEVERIGGRPRFEAQRYDHSAGRSITRAMSVADALDAGWMHKEIKRLEDSVERDPSLAIGTAKELVETCCKTLLRKLGLVVDDKADLPKLTKKLAKELRLVPEGIPNEAKGAETARLILQNFAMITQHLAELRNLYGSGHGRDGSHRGLEPRHARLAVGAAAVFIEFVTETYHKRAADLARAART